MTGKELAAKALDIAKNYKTLYVMGCFGAPLTGSNVSRYCNNHNYNKDATRTAMIKAAANQNPPVYGFDCVNLMKGIVWGWCGDPSKTYGGAQYKTNGCPDYSANGMIGYCTGVSTVFSKDIPLGAALWCEGHFGIYVGDGLGVECTPRWDNCVQITAVSNIGPKSGYNARKWTKWGYLPFITYDENDASEGSQSEPAASQTTTLSHSVGDTVEFTGTKHYVSSNAVNGKSCKSGPAKVTAVAKGAKHPYHLVRVSGKGSTVYGWVDAADIAEEKAADVIAVGKKVKVKSGAKTYTGGSLAAFVYKTTYEVLQISGNRVVIGLNGKVTAAVKASDLTLV